MSVFEPSANVEQKIVVSVLTTLRDGGPIKPHASKARPLSVYAQHEFRRQLSVRGRMLNL